MNDIINTEITVPKYGWRLVFKREFEKIRHSQTRIFITLIGPLLGFALLTWVFSTNVPRNLPIAIVDLDHTSLSRQIARMTDATSIARVSCNPFSLSEARKAMEKGKIDAIIVIPANTEKDILKGKSSTIALYINNSNIVKGGLLNTGLRKALVTLSSGIKLQMQLKSGYTKDQAMARIMPVQLRQNLLFNPYTSYSYYLTLGMLPVILIIFVLMGTTYAIGDELYRGTGPKWIKYANGNITQALFGKLLPYTVIYLFQAIIMNLILFYFLEVPLHGKYFIILISEFLLIISYQALSVFLLGLTTNLRLSLSLGAVYCMLALTYSGLTFPAKGMIAFGQAFSGIFPYTYWIKILLGQSLRGEPTSNSLLPLLGIALFILLGILFIPRLRYMMFNEKRWGKI
jgi:ABC-2 type transport system permease protein